MTPAPNGARRQRLSLVVEQIFPVGRHEPEWPGSGLVERVMQRWGERGDSDGLLGLVVPEPLLVGLEGGGDRVAGVVRVMSCVL